MGVVTVTALEDLCVLKLIGELEHYWPAQLVLLPWHLRQKLLRSLPLADICRLETDSRLTSGVDMNAVWSAVCVQFQELLSPPDNVPGGAYLVRFEQLAHPKDTVMAMIAKLILISATGIMATAYALRLCTPEFTTLSHGQKAGMQHFKDKWGIVRTLLYCSHLPNVLGSTERMESFVHVKLFPTITSLQPKRHSIPFNTRLTNVTEMSERFLATCNTTPKVLKFRRHDSIEHLQSKSPESQLILQSILSGIKEFSVDRSLPQKVPFCISSLEKVLEAFTSLSTASLRSLSFKGVPFFLKEIIQGVANYFIHRVDSLPKQSVSTLTGDVIKTQLGSSLGYTSLRKVEFLSCHPEEKEVVDMQRDEPVCLLSAAVPSLLGILNSQDRLEEIHIDHLYDLTEEGVNYSGFEKLYFSLRDFVKRPHFRSLRIANCHIPLIIAQQLLDTFAHRSMVHPSMLDISECSFDIVSQCHDDPDLINQEDHQMMSTDDLCVEQSKTLAVPYGGFSSMIALPNVQYQRLQLSIFEDNVQLSDMVKYVRDFRPQPKELDIRILSWFPTREDLGAIDEMLTLPHLTKLSIGYLGCEPTPVFDHLASSLGKHSTTTALQGLSLSITAETAPSSYQQVYEAVFSLPQPQSFSLELKFGLRNCVHHFKFLTDAWKIKSNGRKISSLTGLELDEDSVNDFINVGRQVAENVHAFDKFYQ